MTIQKLKIKLLNTGYFKDNEYLDKYCDLIFSNLETKYEKGKTQKHHIIPQCYFKLKNLNIDNSESNIVHLTFSNHLLAHNFLIYCTIGKMNNKMVSSFCFLIKNQNCSKYKNYIIENLDNIQEEYEKAMCELLKYRESKEYKEERSKSLANLLSGRIWIVSEDGKESHIIYPEEITNYPGFTRGKKRIEDTVKY